MSRTIKFRVWDTKEYSYTESHSRRIGADKGGHLFLRFGIGFGNVNWFKDIVIEQWTGLKDANGRDIYEGDILLGSEARFEKILVSDPDDDLSLPVYEVHHDKPLPAPDVPWFKAAVEWNDTMCGFWLKYLDKRADWGPWISTQLVDKHYRYEVVGNIHEGNK